MAIASREPHEARHLDLGLETDREGRLLEARIGSTTFVTCYVPSGASGGQALEMEFLLRIGGLVQTRR